MSYEDGAVEALSALADGEVIDLSQTLEEGMPVVPTHARYGHTLYESYERGDVACHYRLTLGEHTGTHMDAPLHFIAEGDAHYDIASIELGKLIGRAATIDVADIERNTTVPVERIKQWEAEHGDLREGDRVLFRFNWDRHWAPGSAGTQYMADWPGLSGEAAEYLTDTGVALVGCDTAAIDVAHDESFPAHYELLGNETYIVENLTALDALPPFSLLITLPLKIEDGSGSPIRAVAIVD
ncbi:cyclase family protein [Haloferax denitrificans]|uniref:Cyclase family protein n=1 Tax=Haloferax denitrificans ATCC 35960 TaxID=662478 RepID=M0JEY6_9EURY|nr:cyclase family protein [Haloferax denitrificans]EMA07521.1 cyclase family protein [Haloferax denitrificans ATCC 35960]